MAVQRLFLVACVTWMGCMANVIAQDDLDCTRYRAAGLPCPAKPAALSSRVPDAALSAGRLQVLPRLVKPVAPAPAASAARDASGAPLATPPTLRALSAVVPAASPTVITLVPPPAPIITKSTTALQVMPLALPSGSGLTPMAVSAFASPPSSLTVTDNREPGQVIVYWPSFEDSQAALAALVRDRHIQPVSSSRLEHLGGVIAVFQLTTQTEAAEFRDQLVRDYPGLAVDFNTRYRPFQQAKPRIYLPLKIDLPQTNYPIAALTGIRIGMIDGPVSSIAALAGTTIFRKDFLATTETPASSEHATSIATLIAGQDRAAGFLGVAPQASLYSAEIMRSVGQTDMTSSSALIRALDWLLSEKVHVINLSLGGPGDAVMAKAFVRLAEMAVVTVAAAGNGGPGALAAYPAAYAGVIAVTATDALDNAYHLANRGAYITLAAPGVDLWVPDAATGHYVSGTSFAAAVVTAASAWLLAHMPQLHARSLPKQLCRTAKDLGQKGVDPVFGCGLIQIGAALQDDRS
ncbi:MAG: S8 family serine peptidase [Polaromonas sp.]|nr:S8 family serine peptidase [Polaromonas sp.]